MSDTPSPTSSTLDRIKDAGSRLTAAIEGLLPSTEADEALLYSTAETDPPTAAYLLNEGLRPEPRTRSNIDHWAA